MVAVHELGHNLGLWHASSEDLEYGNVFDWMGNYPGVQGLSYGLGYKLKLHWIQPDVVKTITDSDLSSLNDEYVVKPYDMETPPSTGDVMGIKLSLKKNPRDLYVSYRRSTGPNAGI